MSTTKEFWRITLRINPALKAKVRKISDSKRWSMNDFIEESIISSVAFHEGAAD